MAWAEKLPSGRYRGRYRDRSGQEYSLPDTYTSKPEAEREAWRAEDKVRQRPAFKKAAGKQLWRDWLAEWWPNRGVEESTLFVDENRIKLHVEPRWGGTPLERIDREDVQAWVNELKAGRYKASTIAKIYGSLAKSMADAVFAKRIDVNPCLKIKLPPVPPADERFLTRDEYQALREAMPDDRWRVLCDLLVGTGMRWGEAAALHRQRISLDRGRVDVMESYEKVTDTIKAYPKGKQKRSVPVTDDLADTFRQWINDTSNLCHTAHAKESRCTGGLFFHNEGFIQKHVDFEKPIWRKAVLKADVGHVRIHDLRHTYASWLIQEGVSLEQIQLLLGHKDVRTTQRYAHLVDTQWESVRAALAGSTPTAPRLPHADPSNDAENIIRVDFSRRSAG